MKRLAPIQVTDELHARIQAAVRAETRRTGVRQTLAGWIRDALARELGRQGFGQVAAGASEEGGDSG